MFQSVRFLLLLGLCFPWVAHSALQETWETGYAKEDATGPHVLGYWKFDEESKDVTLHGAVFNPKGKFGGALESFPGFPIEDQRHAAVVAVKPVKGG